MRNERVWWRFNENAITLYPHTLLREHQRPRSISVGKIPTGNIDSLLAKCFPVPYTSDRVRRKLTAVRLLYLDFDIPIQIKYYYNLTIK